MVVSRLYRLTRATFRSARQQSAGVTAVTENRCSHFCDVDCPGSKPRSQIAEVAENPSKNTLFVMEITILPERPMCPRVSVRAATKEVPMRKLAIGILAAAGIALSVPASAQGVWIGAGPVGVGVGVGPGYGYYNGYDYGPRYRGYAYDDGYTYRRN